MNERDDRCGADPTRRHERPRVDLVDDDVESALGLLVPVATGFPIDANASSSAHELDAVHALPVRPPGDRRDEQRHVVSPQHERTRDLFRVDLGATCERMSGVLPVEDQDAHGGAHAREGFISEGTLLKNQGRVRSTRQSSAGVPNARTARGLENTIASSLGSRGGIGLHDEKRVPDRDLDEDVDVGRAAERDRQLGVRVGQPQHLRGSRRCGCELQSNRRRSLGDELDGADPGR